MDDSGLGSGPPRGDKSWPRPALCTVMLADYGAEVIKIESAAGDATRARIPPVAADGTGTYFASVNRNKKSVVADLKTEDGLSCAHALVAGCDVVVENFHPGVMAKFGLDYQALAADTPELRLRCRGRSGPARLRPSSPGARRPNENHRLPGGGIGQSRGRPRGRAHRPECFGRYSDALHARDATGTGQQVTFRAGGGTLAIAIGNDRQFATLAEVLGLSGLSSEPRFRTNELRVEEHTELCTALEEALLAATATAWQQKLLAAGFPTAKSTASSRPWNWPAAWAGAVRRPHRPSHRPGIAPAG